MSARPPRRHRAARPPRCACHAQAACPCRALAQASGRHRPLHPPISHPPPLPVLSYITHHPSLSSPTTIPHHPSLSSPTTIPPPPLPPTQQSRQFAPAPTPLPALSPLSPPHRCRCSEMMSKFVGDSEEFIRSLFAEAEAEQLAVGDESLLHVIVFDEIDAFTRERGSLAGDMTGCARRKTASIGLPGVVAYSPLPPCSALTRRTLLGRLRGVALTSRTLLKPHAARAPARGCAHTPHAARAPARGCTHKPHAAQAARCSGACAGLRSHAARCSSARRVDSIRDSVVNQLLAKMDGVEYATTIPHPPCHGSHPTPLAHMTQGRVV